MEATMVPDDHDFEDESTRPESPSGKRKRPLSIAIALVALAGCGSGAMQQPADMAGLDGAGSDGSGLSAALPLIEVAEAPLPGRASRFDYQDIDPEQGLLIVAHMNDSAVLILDLKDGSVKKLLPNIPTPRGVAVADDVGLLFVTSTPGRLVIIDNKTLAEVARVATGTAPDGDAWDPMHKVVGVSDQGDGALSLIPDSGMGTRTQVKLGIETGNVAFDPSRGQFWITVVRQTPPDQLVEVDPMAGTITTRIDLPGCDGAHGLRIHPDGKSAFVACEGNDTLARVDLDGAHTIATADSGAGPDVLAMDPGIGWIYVAAESGDLTVFDLRQPGLVLVGHDAPGDNSHSVAADPATHRVFFPLMQGSNGTPVMRIMRPTVT
jgi:DNA-binding beta-propeller fold protein YncE